MFASLDVDKTKGALFLFTFALFLIFILAYKRVIYPELTSRLRFFVKEGFYEIEQGRLHIHKTSEDFLFSDLDSVVIKQPKRYVQQYGYAKIDFAAVPVRYMMDGKMVINGEGNKCSIYFFDDETTKENLPYTEFLNDILSSFTELKYRDETVKEIICEK